MRFCLDSGILKDGVLSVVKALPYSAALHKDNFYACQFHPEKSGRVGEQIIKNFLDIVK